MSQSYSVIWEEQRLPLPGGELAAGLSDSGVHIWLIPLDGDRQISSELISCLSVEETARAARFHFARDRDRFVAGRMVQRIILAAYVNTAPDALAYSFNKAGKPSLQNGKHKSTITFNFSRSGGHALLAVSMRREIGIDLEAVRDKPSLDLVAKDHFAAGERAGLAALEKALWLEAFYCCWTRKEAVVKALGDGLTAPLQTFEVSVDPRKPAQLLSMNGSVEAAQNWTLTGFRPVEGHWAALAIKGRTAAPQFFRLTDL